MKKIFFTIMLILMVITKVNAKEIDLKEVANAFNNNSSVKTMSANGYDFKATSKGNKLIVTFSYEEITSDIVFNYEENILSANFAGEISFYGSLVSTYLIDSIGTLHGYMEGELLPTIQYKYLNYKLATEGLEINTTDNTYSVKIDITKKIPLKDFSDIYILKEDLENLKEYIKSEGSAQLMIGDVWFYKDNDTIIIAEKNGLTNRSYESLLSVLDVMFSNSKAKDYFKENYSGIKDGNKEFKGFKVETTFSDEDLKNLKEDFKEDYEFLKVTVDYKKVKDKISNRKIVFAVIAVFIVTASLGYLYLKKIKLK